MSYFFPFYLALQQQLLVLIHWKVCTRAYFSILDVGEILIRENNTESSEAIRSGNQRLRRIDKWCFLFLTNSMVRHLFITIYLAQTLKSFFCHLTETGFFLVVWLKLKNMSFTVPLTNQSSPLYRKTEDIVITEVRLVTAAYRTGKHIVIRCVQSLKETFPQTMPFSF